MRRTVAVSPAGGLGARMRPGSWSAACWCSRRPKMRWNMGPLGSRVEHRAARSGPRAGGRRHVPCWMRTRSWTSASSTAWPTVREHVDVEVDGRPDRGRRGRTTRARPVERPTSGHRRRRPDAPARPDRCPCPLHVRPDRGLARQAIADARTPRSSSPRPGHAALAAARRRHHGSRRRLDPQPGVSAARRDRRRAARRARASWRRARRSASPAATGRPFGLEADGPDAPRDGDPTGRSRRRRRGQGRGLGGGDAHHDRPCRRAAWSTARRS